MYEYITRIYYDTQSLRYFTDGLSIGVDYKKFLLTYYVIPEL